ncbi:MAG: hypothetical protein ABEI74_04335, partial [Candidatus Pacearchaeota archaeon]
TVDVCIEGGNCLSSVSGGGGSGTKWNLSGTSLFPNSTSYDVGIGTSSPSSKLEVNGTINASGDINNSGQVSLAGNTIKTSSNEVTINL